MAVQIPDPGTGNAQTGDNEYVFRKKVKDNFSDQTNAASRLLGAAAGQVPLAEHTYKAAFSADMTLINTEGYDTSSLPIGSRVVVSGTAIDGNLPYNGAWHIDTISSIRGGSVQFAYAYPSALGMCYRVKDRSTGVYAAWQSVSTSELTYKTTTASGANVVVASNGVLQRSTSSERYKDIFAPLELDDARYEDAMALKPIVYRSTAEADNPAYHYYSFSAEELGAYDPAFTLWRETEMVTDADGNVTEQPLAERQAEGININALLAMSHAIAIKQDKIIKALEARIEILEAK
ncbi:hypothetical protein [Psychrobacter piscatorii]|uniref:Peptidase S74 domain-containing protein n=1 Tax=Psychrobacter piscatorii TaxID=554343 RepID=A0A0T6DUS3_9GAMM|nr:hypothetical protein [Psychrobacter piscatorii]KRU23546.1 hypothetical protein AS194_04040 [Psychrobacter piscatorii]